MNNFFSFIILVMGVLFISCNNGNINSILSSQMEDVHLYFGNDIGLDFRCFENTGILQEVKKVDALGSSTVLKFNSKGKLLSKFFLDKHGNKVGDEIHFDVNKGFNDYYFWKDSKSLLFTGIYNEEKIFATEGKPWLISGPSSVESGDTILYYIAAPLIPNFKTKVRFGKKDRDLEIEYFNDIRQMDYKTIIDEIGLHEFLLKVDIINSEKKVVYSDSTSVELEVLSRIR